MPSLVAIETISTYETIPGQPFSSSSLMKSILLKPSRSEMVFIRSKLSKKLNNEKKKKRKEEEEERKKEKRNTFLIPNSLKLIVKNGSWEV